LEEDVKWINYIKSIKPIYIAFLVLGFGLALAVISSNKFAKDIKSQSETFVASGLSSYGGDAIFASLVANGINDVVQSQYPDLQLRYVKPLNQDFSSVNGIDLLIKGELSFAYNASPLSNSQYEKAHLRGFNLKQVPIAIDSISVFSNLWTPTDQLNLKQVKAIFDGQLTNWQQINPKYASLPIVPVIVNNENYQAQALNLGNASTAIKVSNYTEAVRKVINTPGAISLASSSLVQNQRLVKIYSLADGNTSKYIKPINDNELNRIAIVNGTYPLTRRLFIVFRQDGINDQFIGETITKVLISHQGQKTIKKSYLLSEHFNLVASLKK
jgi:phosphate transport system substrate-binding protein